MGAHKFFGQKRALEHYCLGFADGENSVHKVLYASCFPWKVERLARAEFW
jgi:hypothetical protein